MYTNELHIYRDWIQHIDHEVRTLTVGLSDEQWSWRPAPNEWSIAHCIDHLAVTNGLLVPLFETAVQQLRERDWRSTGPFRYNLVERMSVNIFAPNAAPWLKVPGIYRPAPQPNGPQALGRFMALEERLLTCMERADGYDIGRIKIPSPELSFLWLRLGAWFAAVVNHNRNHLQQAQRVRGQVRVTSNE